jgi:hypothetical protein
MSGKSIADHSPDNKADFDIVTHAGEHVRVGVVDVLDGDFAIDGVLVGLDGISRRIAQRHDAAQGVEVVVIDGVGVGDLDHTDGLVDARAVDVFAQQVVIAVVFGDHVGAVIDVAGAVAIDLLFNAPA